MDKTISRLRRLIAKRNKTIAKLRDEVDALKTQIHASAGTLEAFLCKSKPRRRSR